MMCFEFDERFRAALAACDLGHAGCTDDGWDVFLDWIITQGHATFDADAAVDRRDAGAVPPTLRPLRLRLRAGEDAS